MVSWKLDKHGRSNPVKLFLTALCLIEMEPEAHLHDDSAPVLGPFLLASAVYIFELIKVDFGHILLISFFLHSLHVPKA